MTATNDVILSSEEVAKRRAQRAVSLKPEIQKSEESQNRGGRIPIQYETMGRFRTYKYLGLF